MNLKIIALAIVFAAFVGIGAVHTPAYASEAEKPAVGSEVAAIPATVPEIWQAVDREMAEMQKLIDAGTVEDLHHRAFAVRDLVAALADHSSALAPDKLEKVKGDSKFVATLASRLDEAGDSKDKAAASANFAKLENLLKSIREYYPETTK